MIEITTIQKAQSAIAKSFETLVKECRQVLSSELHDQAMLYHILRTEGQVPINQMGMNVKTSIFNFNNEYLHRLNNKKHVNFQSAIELIPDMTIYSSGIQGDWRRRNYENTLKETLYAMEVKASERHNGRLTFGQIEKDVMKLVAQREQTKEKHGKTIFTGELIVDTAIDHAEWMRSKAIEQIEELCREHNIDLWYLAQSDSWFRLNAC